MSSVHTHPNPSRLGGADNWGRVTQGVGSKTRLCPRLLSRRPYRTSVCAGARIV